MPVRRVDHVGVVVDDYDEACGFLAALGMRLESEAVYGSLAIKTAFFRCGEVQVEIVECSDPEVRQSRLQGNRARIEHIALEVDDIDSTVSDLARTGLRLRAPGVFSSADGSERTCFTDPGTSGGILYQLVDKTVVR